jgi:hypothetical protein
MPKWPPSSDETKCWPLSANPSDSAPVADLAESPMVCGGNWTVPGAGQCRATAMPLAYPSQASLSLARSGGRPEQ